MIDKPRYPWIEMAALAGELVAALAPACGVRRRCLNR